jgi:hypothetical protein
MMARPLVEGRIQTYTPRDLVPSHGWVAQRPVFSHVKKQNQIMRTVHRHKLVISWTTVNSPPLTAQAAQKLNYNIKPGRMTKM